MNVKKILLGSAIAATTIGFIACGGDSSSVNTPTNPDNPGAPVIDLPKQSALNPIQFTEISITSMAGANGTQGSLSGVIKIDPDFFSDEGAFAGDTNQVTRIDSVRFAVGKVIDGNAFQENITINLDGVVFPTDRIALSKKFFEYSSLSSCGQFQLYVFVFSSTVHTADPSVKPIIYTSVYDKLTFTRNELECKAPEPESSSAAVEKTCTPVTANTVELGNTSATDQKAINFATGLATDPHVTLKVTDEEAYLIPSAGVTIYEDNGQTTGLQPENANPGQPVCMEDFQKSARTYDEELTSGLWLEIVTPDGKMYPVMIKSPMFQTSTMGTVTLIYYK